MKANAVNRNYKWVIATVCFVTIMIALGLCSSSKGLFLKPVTAGLGIARGLYSITDTIRYATTALVNLIFAVLIVKLGAKRMMILGVMSLAVSMLLYSFAPAGGSALTFGAVYSAGFFLGLGLAWSTTTMIGYVIGQWFTENRGTVMGVILAANGLGSALASKLLNPVIIGEAQILGQTGFRVAYRLIAALLVAVIVMLLLFFRNAPEDKLGKQNPKKRRGRQWVGIEWSDVKKKYYFYVTAVCIFLTGMALQSVGSVSKAHLTDIFGENYATTIFAVYSIVLCGTKFLSGFSYDRMGLRKTMLVCNTAAAIGIFTLALVPKEMQAVGMTAQIILAFAMPLETVMLPLIAADMFGEKCFPKIMGLFVSINTAGYAVGSPITNAVFDALGDYRLILMIFGVLMTVILFVEQIDLHHAEKDREAFLGEEKEENRITRRRVGLAILLSFVTLGIYAIYWLCKLIKSVKALRGDKTGCVGELLCMLFLPFYSLFWWITRGDAVKEILTKRGCTVVGSKYIYMFLSLFGLGIIAMAIMQNDFNTLPAEEVPSLPENAE